MPLNLKEEDIDKATGKIKEELLGDDLYDLDLSKCGEWLKPTPQLIKQLEDLEKRDLGIINFDLTWPRHFGREENVTLAKIRLNKIIKQYRTSGHPEGAPNLVIMLNRYMDEFTREFPDSASQISENVNALLEIVEQNPEHLTWMNKVAALYLTGCVNQPVFGFTRILAWASLSKESDVNERLKMAKQLMVMDYVADFVTSKRIAQSLEVNVGNYLLRDVHNILLENGSLEKEWLGIHQQVFGEKKFVENISGIEGYAQEFLPIVLRILDKTPAQLADFVCGTMEINSLTLEKISIWARIVFFDQVNEIENKYSTLTLQSQSLVAKLNLQNDKLESEVNYHDVKQLVGSLFEKLAEKDIQNIADKIPIEWLPNSQIYDSKIVSKKEGEKGLVVIKDYIDQLRHREISDMALAQTKSSLVQKDVDNISIRISDAQDKKPSSSCCGFAVSMVKSAGVYLGLSNQRD